MKAATMKRTNKKEFRLDFELLDDDSSDDGAEYVRHVTGAMDHLVDDHRVDVGRFVELQRSIADVY